MVLNLNYGLCWWFFWHLFECFDLKNIPKNPIALNSFRSMQCNPMPMRPVVRQSETVQKVSNAENQIQRKVKMLTKYCGLILKLPNHNCGHLRTVLNWEYWDILSIVEFARWNEQTIVHQNIGRRQWFIVQWHWRVKYISIKKTETGAITNLEPFSRGI